MVGDIPILSPYPYSRSYDYIPTVLHQLIGGIHMPLFIGFQPSCWWCRISSIHSTNKDISTGLTIFQLGQWNFPTDMDNRWLIGGIPTPLKNDGVRQLGWRHSQLNGKSWSIPWFQSPPTRYHPLGEVGLSPDSKPSIINPKHKPPLSDCLSTQNTVCKLIVLIYNLYRPCN